MDKKDKTLLNQLRISPDEGMSNMIELYMPTVQAICKHILSSEGNGIAEDAVQETFIKIWLFAKSGKRMYGSMKGFICQIARNQALDKLRESKAKMGAKMIGEDIATIEGLVGTWGTDLETDFARRHNFNLIHKLINEMKEPDRQIFVLRYFYNYKIREIASETGLPEDNVESRIRRNRELLKQGLIEGGIFYEGK